MPPEYYNPENLVSQGQVLVATFFATKKLLTRPQNYY